MQNSPDENVYEGSLTDDGPRPPGNDSVGINWRTYKLPGLDVAKHQVAGVEAIRAAKYEAIIANSEQLGEIGVAKVVRYAQFAHQVVQLEPDMAPFLRDIDRDLKAIVRNSLYQYTNEKRG